MENVFPIEDPDPFAFTENTSVSPMLMFDDEIHLLLVCIDLTNAPLAAVAVSVVSPLAVDTVAFDA